MSEFKGTQGNWRVVEDSKYMFDIMSDDITIATIWEEKAFRHSKIPIHEEVEANVKLIAVAPDLLEAAMNIENDDERIPKALWDQLQAAIKKATE